MRARPERACPPLYPCPPTWQIGGFLVNAPARHPYVDRPLIDVRVTTFLAPCEMAGAQLGVLLNQMLPSLVIFVAMVSRALALTLNPNP